MEIWHYFANKGPSSQGYGFSSSHVWMWELDYKESWPLKNWCFWTVVLEKTLESPYGMGRYSGGHSSSGAREDSWESPGHQGDQTSQSQRKSVLNIHLKDWCWSSNILATWCKELTPWKRPWSWERLRAVGEGETEDEMVGWYHRLNGHEFEQAPGVGDGQGSLAFMESQSQTWLSDKTARAGDRLTPKGSSNSIKAMEGTVASTLAIYSIHIYMCPAQVHKDTCTGMFTKALLANTRMYTK